ncbi:MAG: diguanylate cyclase [Betaproteobacteria bacterium]|nr:MAG: diguanylate cyclase [Betaproteobacteria bacterium]
MATRRPTGKTTRTAARREADAFDPRRLGALSGDWFWVQDARLRLTHLSGSLGEKAGVDLAAYLGAKRWDQPALNLTQDDWDRHRAQVERREPFHDFEIQCLADDGRTLWLSLSAQPVLDEADRFNGYVGVGRDITAQKRSEQLLRLEHAVARSLAEASSTSDALKATLGTIGESEGWDCADFWKVDDAAWVLRRVERWSAPGIEARFTASGKPADIALQPGVGLAGSVWQSGEPLWIADAVKDPRAATSLMPEETGLHSVLLFPVRHGRRVVGVLDFRCRAVRAPEPRFLETLQALSHHIGPLLQRALAEQARRESEARFRSLTNLASDWYWEMDSSYSFTRLEGRHVAGGDEDLARRLIGIRRWESGLEVEGGWDAHRALLDARKAFYEVLMWRLMADGRMRYISVSGEPLFNPDGSFAGYHGVGRDVTPQKRAEQMLRLEHGVARSLASAEDRSSGLKAVILALCESEGWDVGRYFQADEAGGLRFVDGWCVSEPGMEGFVERSRAVWQSGKAVWSGDISRAPETLSDLAGAQGVFAFPVLSEGRPIGVLAFSGYAVRAPDERLQQAARVIGSQVGQFLQRKQAEEARRESEARFRSLTQMSSDFFWETDAQHRFVSIVHGPNYAATEMGLIGKAAWEIDAVSPDEAGWAAHQATLESQIPFRDFEFARVMPDGMTRYFALSGEPRLAAEGSFLGYRGVGRDVTESALTRERIASLAYRDPLTGLANRTSLAPALEQAVERARRRGVKLAGVFIDLDGFKQINDFYGHDAGDRCLIEVARRLRSSVRASDVVARLGGDEFFVLLEEVHDELAVESVIRKLLAEAVRPYELPAGAQARVSASMGVSVFPDNSSDAAALIKNADTAMYSAKQAGKNGYCFFSGDSNGPALRIDPGRANPAPAARSALERATARPAPTAGRRTTPSCPEGE